MVSANIVPAPSDEHLMEDRVSKVETVVEDECDVPVQVEESRNPSSVTTHEEVEALPLTSPRPEADTSDATTAPSGDRMGSWFRRDGAESARPSSRNFWFRKQAQSEQDTVNLAFRRRLDESARKNEERGTSTNRQQNAPWWRFGSPVAKPMNEKKDLNDEFRQYLDRDSNNGTQQGGSPSPPQEGSQNETAIVVRSESVNVLWDFMSQAVRQSALWRAATRVHESSKAAAEQRAKQGAAMRHGIRKFFRRRNTEDEQESAESETEKQDNGSRQPWWRRFGRNRSQVVQVDGETSTAIVPYGTGPHPVAAVMKKAAAGVTGTCMVIVGVPLLLFPVPGPGVAMIASGVYVVSTEFEFARSWLETVKNRFGNVFDRLGIEVATPDALPPPTGPSPHVLALPPSLPPADEEEHEITFSNDEEETGGSKSEEIFDKDEDEMPDHGEEACTIRI